MEQRNAERHESLRKEPCAAKDAPDRFLSDLRALRARAGLDEGELAARAHYPRDVITAAESGQALPELPVLAAYVRGCGGFGSDVAEWEDRWRAVTGTAASPLLPARVAGSSSAASAGARIFEASATVAATSTEGQDPTAVMDALDRFAARMAQPAVTANGSASAGASAAAPANGHDLAAEPLTEPADGLAEPAPGLAGPARVTPAASPRRAAGRRTGVSGRTLVGIVIAVLLLCLILILAL